MTNLFNWLPEITCADSDDNLHAIRHNDKGTDLRHDCYKPAVLKLWYRHSLGCQRYFPGALQILIHIHTNSINWTLSAKLIYLEGCGSSSPSHYTHTHTHTYMYMASSTRLLFDTSGLLDTRSLRTPAVNQMMIDLSASQLKRHLNG
jgi:hypothetical protein